MTIEDLLAERLVPAMRDVVRAELRAVMSEMKPASAGEYLTVAQAAEIANVHPETVRVWIRDGRLPRHHAGREHRVLRTELEDFLRVTLTPPDEMSLEARATAILNRSRGGR